MAASCGAGRPGAGGTGGLRTGGGRRPGPGGAYGLRTGPPQRPGLRGFRGNAERPLPLPRTGGARQGLRGNGNEVGPDAEANIFLRA
jgi:hypothetical protein